MIWWPFKGFDLKPFHRRWATESLTRLKPLATVSRSPPISVPFQSHHHHLSPVTICHFLPMARWPLRAADLGRRSSSRVRCPPNPPDTAERSAASQDPPGKTPGTPGCCWGKMWRKCWVNLCYIYKRWIEEWHSKSGRCRQCRRLNSGNTSSIAQRLWTLDGAEGSVTVYLDQYDHWASPVHIALWPLVASRGNRSVR